MRYYWITLIVLASLLTSAKGLLNSQTLPDCALPCLDIATVDCTSNDISCLCQAGQNITSQFYACLQPKCSVIDTLAATNATATACGLPVRYAATPYLIAMCVFAGVAFVMFCLRMLSKTPLFGRRPDWSDLLLVVGEVCNIIQFESLLRSMKNGLGRDIWTLSPEQITNYIRMLYSAEINYSISLCCVRLSILHFYLTIFQDRPIRIAIYAVALFNIIGSIVLTIIIILQCLPISYIYTGWKDGYQSGKCINLSVVGLAAAAFSMICDLMILCLPLKSLLGLNLSLKRKLQVITMFSFGLLTFTISIYRIPSLYAWSQSGNFTYDNTALSGLTQIEVEVAVICACMPALRLLIVRVSNSSKVSNALGRSTNTAGKSAVSQNDFGQRSKLSMPASRVAKDDIESILDMEHSVTKSTDGGGVEPKG